MVDDDFTLDELPDEPAEADPSALAAILAKALSDTAGYGGADHARLAGVIGKGAFDLVNSQRSGRKAIDAWINASPKSKPAATKLLAVTIARATEHPDMVDRIVREIDESNWWDDRPNEPATKNTPVKAQGRAVRAQQRSGQRVADPDLLELARSDDISAYRNARLRPRRQEQHRHGI